MKSHINSTGRKRITHDLVRFELVRDGEGRPTSFVADLSALAHLGLPPHARVVVEPFIKSSSMRFEFGTASAIAAPSDCRLTDLDRNAGDVLFRVKVIDDTDSHVGRLLASGDHLPEVASAEAVDGQKPLLPVKSIWLEERMWCVEVGSGDRPYLCVNQAIPGLASELSTNALLRGAILPEAFREVVRAMLLGDDERYPWYDDWRTFLVSVLGQPDPAEIADDDERRDYLEDVTGALTSKFKFVTMAVPTVEAVQVLHD